MKQYYFECKLCGDIFKGFSDGTDIWSTFCKDCVKNLDCCGLEKLE